MKVCWVFCDNDIYNINKLMINIKIWFAFE